MASRSNAIQWGILTFLALLVGMLYVAPSLLIQRSIEARGDIFLLPQVSHPIYPDSMVWYIPPAREVADGHLLPSDLYVPEHKGPPFLRPPLPSLLLGGIIALVGNPSPAYLLAIFIFSCAAFGLFYWFGRELTGNKIGATAVALIGTLTPIAIYHRPNPQLSPIIILKSFLPYVRTPVPNLFLSRINEPLLTLPFFILFFVLLWRFWKKPTVGRGVALGIATAILPYVYLHYTIFAAMFLAVLFIIYVFSDRRRNLGGWIAVLISAAVIGTPFIVNYIMFRSLPEAANYLWHWRVVVEYGRGIRLSVWKDYLLYAILTILMVLLLRRRERETFKFFAALIITLVLIWNMPLIFGAGLLPDHWWKVFGLPLYALVIVLTTNLVILFQERWPKISPKIPTAVLLLLLALLVTKRALNAAAYFDPPEETRIAFTFPKPIYESWQWIRTNIPPESIVVSNSFLTSIYLTGYTSVNPYLPFAEETLLSQEEINRRFLSVSKLFGVSEEMLRLLLRSKYYGPQTACPPPCEDAHTSRNFLRVPEMLFGEGYNPRADGFDALTRSYDHYVPLEVIDELIARYRTITPRWADFSGYYVYYGPWERQLATVNLRNHPELELIYENDGVELYRVRSGS